MMVELGIDTSKRSKIVGGGSHQSELTAQLGNVLGCASQGGAGGGFGFHRTTGLIKLPERDAS